MGRAATSWGNLCLRTTKVWGRREEGLKTGQRERGEVRERKLSITEGFQEIGGCALSVRPFLKFVYSSPQGPG